MLWDVQSRLNRMNSNEEEMFHRLIVYCYQWTCSSNHAFYKPLETSSYMLVKLNSSKQVCGVKASDVHSV